MRNIHILGDLVAILDPLPVGCVLDSFNSRVFYHNSRSTQEEEIVYSRVVDKPNTLLIVRNFYHFMPVITVDSSRLFSL